VPLRYQLQNGDTVEIITTDHQTPSRDWLKFVKTARAKERIRAWSKAQQATRSVEVGREILARDLARFDLDLVRLARDGALERVAHELGVKDFATLVAEVGYGKIMARQVIERLVSPEQIDKPPEPEGALARLFRVVARRPEAAGVRVGGLEDILVRFARCCDPLPGERIAGYMTRGRGVTVHAAGCPKLVEADPQRRVTCVWDGGPSLPRPVRLEVLCVDQPGLLAGISKAIAQSGINIRKAEARPVADGKSLNTFEVMVAHAEDLMRVMRNMMRVRGVMRVDRIREP
jgi:GTP pyrophosphokinase